MPTPDIRITHCNEAPPRDGGEFVLYWMIAQRRLEDNFALERAVEWANQLGRPLVILEPLRCGYHWASDRLHRFILDGMADHRGALGGREGVTYYPYVEPEHGAGAGLLKALAARACVVVTDDYPCFFLPKMVRAAAGKLDVRLEMVDANGLLPLRATTRIYTTAYSFRRGLHKLLPEHLEQLPSSDPLAALEVGALPEGALDDVTARWPHASRALLEERDPAALAALPIDHEVGVVAWRGGGAAARARLALFIDEILARYPDARNKPEEDGSSNLSAHLHFGHIGAHTIFKAVVAREGWTADLLAEKPTGKREGWWGMSEEAEAFLDELITWREIGFNMSHHEPDTYDTFEQLPDFARQTLLEHAEDEREYVYTLAQFERAETHDELWNAAQNQLRREGRMHNYLRMLWGKKILEWTASPASAVEVMIELNNKYALDGRDPNSYSGIFWCLGRYDRGWTERPIFGKVRYMTSASTRRKHRVDDYIARYTSPE